MRSNTSSLTNIIIGVLSILFIWLILDNPSNSYYVPVIFSLLIMIITELFVIKADYSEKLYHVIGVAVLILVLMWVVIYLMIPQGYSLKILVVMGLIFTFGSLYITYIQLKRWKKIPKN
jgi:hypothetical protein